MRRANPDDEVIRCAAIDFNDELHFEILARLAQEHSFEKLYVLHGPSPDELTAGSRKILEVLEDKVAAISAQEFYYKRNLEKLSIPQGRDAEDLLLSYGHLRKTFDRMCARASLIELDASTLRDIFLRVTSFFEKLCIDQQFNLVVLLETPHSFYSFIFYQILVARGIGVVRVEHHILSGYSVLLDEGGLPSIPERYLADHSREELYQKLPHDFEKTVHGGNAAFKKWTGKEHRRAPGRSRSRTTAIKARYLKKAAENLLMGALPWMFRKHHHGNASLNDPMNDWQYRRLINRLLWKQYGLLQKYLSVAGVPDPDSQYIYFAMHMQPEKTSLPLAGPYSDQLLAITTLSQALPDGWMLLVKDHPNQFNPALISNVRFRSMEFYDAISQLTNVRMIAPDQPSAQLIKHCQLVATLTGSVGWEALLAHKPVLAFGESYYENCQAVRRPDSVESCRQGILDLIELTANDVSLALARYLTFMFDRGLLFQGCAEVYYIALEGLLPSTQVQQVSAAISRRIKAIFPSE